MKGLNEFLCIFALGQLVCYASEKSIATLI